MNAADVMTSPPVVVNPDTTVRTASALLGDHGFSALPVVDDEGRLVGIVSGADLLLAGMSRETANGPVARVMRQSVISAPTSATPAELTSTMLSQRLRCLPIVADGQLLVGVVSRSDLLRILTPADAALAARVEGALRAYSSGPRWTVSVRDGEVDVSGPFADVAERRVVEALVRTVPGVRGSRVGTQGGGR
ncbi:MAG TPA: CBS domain-containing protein [Lentzea sp.]